MAELYQPLHCSEMTPVLSYSVLRPSCYPLFFPYRRAVTGRPYASTGEQGLSLASPSLALLCSANSNIRCCSSGLGVQVTQRMKTLSFKAVGATSLQVLLAVAEALGTASGA